MTASTAARLSKENKYNGLRGADWYPDSRTVGFGALINIRPDQGNRGMEIESPELRRRVEKIVRQLLGGGK